MTDAGNPMSDAQPSKATISEERLKRLTHVSRGFTYAASLTEILHYAAEQAADLLDADKAILMLADDDGLLRVHASFGVSEDVVHRFRASFDESLVSRLQGLFGTGDGFLGVPLVDSSSRAAASSAERARCRAHAARATQVVARAKRWSPW